MPLIIIVIGLALIVLNFNGIKKEKTSFNNVLSNQDNIHKDYDVELFAIRKDMAESILDLQKEIGELREIILNKKEIEKEEVSTVKNEEKVDDILREIDTNEGVISQIDFNNSIIKVSKESIDENNKVENIKSMLSLGYSDEEICESLKIGKGEVLLIKELFK